jgi:hypothetical protein
MRTVVLPCRAQIDALQQQLQEEAAARKKMEEEMKRSFMRGQAHSLFLACTGTACLAATATGGRQVLVGY